MRRQHELLKLCVINCSNYGVEKHILSFKNSNNCKWLRRRWWCRVFATIKDGTIIGMQAKWFLESITSGQFLQIKNSIKTALRVRPLIKKYIVCIPRDLSSDRSGKGKKVVEDNELNRWKRPKNELEDDYPGLEIELWNETQLLTT